MSSCGIGGARREGDLGEEEGVAGEGAQHTSIYARARTSSAAESAWATAGSSRWKQDSKRSSPQAMSDAAAVERADRARSASSAAEAACSASVTAARPAAAPAVSRSAVAAVEVRASEALTTLCSSAATASARSALSDDTVSCSRVRVIELRRGGRGGGGTERQSERESRRV